MACMVDEDDLNQERAIAALLGQDPEKAANRAIHRDRRQQSLRPTNQRFVYGPKKRYVTAKTKKQDERDRVIKAAHKGGARPCEIARVVGLTYVHVHRIIHKRLLPQTD